MPGEVNRLWAEPDRDLRVAESRPQVANTTDRDSHAHHSPLIINLDSDSDGDVDPHRPPLIIDLDSDSDVDGEEDQPLPKVDPDTDRDVKTHQIQPETDLTPLRGSKEDDKSLVSIDRDQEMQDVTAIRAQDETPLIEHGTASQQVHVSPSLALRSRTSSISFDEKINPNVDETANNLNQQNQDPTQFNIAELDFYLAAQAEQESGFQTTTQELLKTQIWGHIDPRVVWAEEKDEEWLAEKRCEIDARGGKKANYGKLLTTQVRKEREQKGWQIHQNSEALSGHIVAETARHMEELFGIKGMDDLIPGVRDGQLVMTEKSVDIEAAKRKRKAALKYYVVH
jgi:hypothetical protein